MTYLIGVGLVVVFCVYAISHIWSLQNSQEDKQTKLKALVFYLFIIILAVLFFLISTFSGTPLDLNR